MYEQAVSISPASRACNSVAVVIKFNAQRQSVLFYTKGADINKAHTKFADCGTYYRERNTTPGEAIFYNVFCGLSILRPERHFRWTSREALGNYQRIRSQV